MVKPPFVVGFMVAELPMVELDEPQSDGKDNRVSGEELRSLPPLLDLDKKKSWEIQTLRIKDEPVGMRNFTSEQRSNAVDISQSLAMAYVMDQVYILHLNCLKVVLVKLFVFCGSCFQSCTS